MNPYVIALVATAFAGPAFAQGSGDAAAGEKAFKKCKSCHMIVADDGTVLVKGGRTGPNLYGIIGKPAGTVEGFKFGKDIIAAGEAGLEWTGEEFVAYTQNPRNFIREYLGDDGAKSKMTFRLKKGGEDIYAYLLSLSAE